jgi:DNA repair protein RadC
VLAEKIRRDKRFTSRTDQGIDGATCHGEAKAAQIKATIELGRRLTLLVQYEISALEQEHLRVILLDRRNRVLEIVEVYKARSILRKYGLGNYSRMPSG